MKAASLQANRWYIAQPSKHRALHHRRQQLRTAVRWKNIAAQVQETVGQGAFIVTFKNLAKVKRLYSDIIQGLFFGFGAELWQEQHVSDIFL